ncbi:MurR/RpiR family transcriptional regulator [Agrococcus sp. HG114]|uniref:MurR/RpiR family transcriptional regulator n=1 Tax=Agrococcus sp. HG114 TaxID=2969757 RepID=UPI00215A77FF|nr:MurR/RpiR family transcriptional regulator [Agrococcus sp. HG114]MCR8669983.1 MurR/RpiR family transcriptional regulator [Agrococcus sp. HG114]
MTGHPESAGAGALSDLVRGALDTLSDGERKVARALLAHYPIAGLETVAELARRASVSPPTVVRFVTRLGFGGYPEFQRRLMREVHERLGSPLEQYGRPELHVADDGLARAARILSAGVTGTIDALPQREFDVAVELLSDPRRPVSLVGGRFSRMLAQYLGSHLALLRPHTAVLEEGELGRLTAVSDLERRSVLVVFDYRRYDPEVVRLARVASERGAAVVLFTDRWLSPAAEVATAVLPSDVHAPSPFDSLVPALALVEAVIAGVTARRGEAGRERIEQVEALRGAAAARGR